MASTMNSIQRFFGKKTSEEMVKKWQQDIRAQNRGIERQIRSIEREEAKVKASIKQVAKRGDTKSCKSLAKELVRSRKHKDRLYTSKAQLNSVSMQLTHQLATLKIAGTLQKSTEVMTLVNQLIRLPEISKTMQEMSMEMTKAGIIDEMIGDTFEMMDDEDMEEEADEEVNKVLYQVTEGIVGTLGEATSVTNLQNPVIPAAEEEEEEPELDMMQKRLEVSMTFTSKQLLNQSKRATKDENAEKTKLKTAIQKGNMEGARLHAANAIRKKNESLNLLRLSSRIDAVASRVQTAVTMHQVTGSMANVVKGMDKAMQSMNLEKISMVMDKFESQFEDLDVQTEYMEGAMAGTTTMTTPQTEVDSLMQQVADEHGLEMNQEFGNYAPGTSIAGLNKQEEKDVEADKLDERLRALRQ
ncbi:hypothetical protein NQZ79_g8302 [Umbelopsis isabellina]|nr:hypothetical protein NQZ79_g8302 [Umbelopsis isabellina]